MVRLTNIQKNNDIINLNYSSIYDDDLPGLAVYDCRQGKLLDYAYCGSDENGNVHYLLGKVKDALTQMRYAETLPDHVNYMWY